MSKHKGLNESADLRLLSGFLGVNPSASPLGISSDWNHRSKSFLQCHLDTVWLLTTFFTSFWVCEKSDGIRVLLLVLPDANGEQTSFIVSS